MLWRHSFRVSRIIGARGFASASTRVKIVGSNEAYKQITSVDSGRKAVVYFTAKWCPPCKMISPIYDELSSQYPDVDFAKVDVDDQSEISSRAGIRSMPTFYAFNNGKLQNQLSFSGADEALLRSNIKKLSEL